MARMPFRWTSEWTTALPDDSPMALFINGQITTSREHEPLRVRRGALYRRRVLIWRGRWKLAELNGWDSAAGDWEEREVHTDGPEVPADAGQSDG